MKRTESYLKKLLSGKLRGHVVELFGAEEHLNAVTEGSRVITPNEAMALEKLDNNIDSDLLMQLSRDDNTEYKAATTTRRTAARTSKSPMGRSNLAREERNF